MADDMPSMDELQKLADENGISVESFLKVLKNEIPSHDDGPVIVSEDELRRIIRSFDKMADEINQMFMLLSQGIAIALEPMRDQLEKLKEKLDVVYVEHDNDKDTSND